MLGDDHPDTLSSRNNLACAYESAGRLDEAIDLYEQTLTDRRRVLGDDHPDTLTSRNNLAYAYESAGRLDEAIDLYEQTLTDSERVLGDDHPDTLSSRNNLAGAYASAGRLDEAIALYEQTLTDRRRVLGDDHPDTLTSRNNLAYAYASAGRLDEAIPLYEQTLTDRRAGAGRRPPGHPVLPQQPRLRLPVGGPAGRGDRPVRADPHRLRASAGVAPSHHQGRAGQPGSCAQRREPDHRLPGVPQSCIKPVEEVSPGDAWARSECLTGDSVACLARSTR